MGADLTANSHEGEQIPALVLDPIPDLGIQILWHLFEASTKGEPLSLSDAWEKVGGEVSPFLSAAHELYQRGLIVSHLFLLRLTHEGRMALLSLVCAGKCRKLYNFAGCAQAVASVPGELALTAEKTSGYAPVGLAGIHIVKPHEPEKCECGEAMARRCRCGAAICHRHGYMAGEAIVCGGCKAEADVEADGVQRLGRADVGMIP